MKSPMKTPLIPFMLLVSAACTSCQDKSAYRLNFDVADDAGNKVEGVTIKTAVHDYWQPGEGFGKDIAHLVETVTDKEGAARLSESSSRCEMIIFANKPGYYESQCPFKSTSIVDDRWQPWNATIKVELKRVLQPIPLIAKKASVGWGEYMRLPADKAAYDLEVGDWTAPYGAGKAADLIFEIRGKTDKPGENYETTLILSFSQPQDGMIFVERPKQSVSALIMPYQAPNEGYQAQKTWRKLRINTVAVKGGYIEGKLEDETKPDEDYFLRLRTKLNEKGEIVSAHYAKVQGSFLWWPTGWLKFQYHFNLTPNDRNLEFDPTKNLLKVERGQEVTEP